VNNNDSQNAANSVNFSSTMNSPTKSSFNNLLGKVWLNNVVEKQLDSENEQEESEVAAWGDTNKSSSLPEINVAAPSTPDRSVASAAKTGSASLSLPLLGSTSPAPSQRHVYDFILSRPASALPPKPVEPLPSITFNNVVEEVPPVEPIKEQPKDRTRRRSLGQQPSGGRRSTTRVANLPSNPTTPNPTTTTTISTTTTTTNTTTNTITPLPVSSNRRMTLQEKKAAKLTATILIEDTVEEEQN
jgi:hypothetical protein